jgi:zinc protease
MIKKLFSASALVLSATLVLAQVPADPRASHGTANLDIPYTKHVLDNGLEVIIHEDHSDPVAAVAIMFNVGSNREKPGRTGFAHFFEHMLFQASENVGKGEFFKAIEDLGGEFNGGTSSDRTTYYEVVPKDALDRVLWMEADRMGFMINTVTTAVLENEKQVVKNEKRQRVDNRPYGHESYVIDKAMYPEGHPYNWQVIGSLEDLQAATVEDVKEFYDKWYGPNNATMVIAGDVDPKEVLKKVKYYFDEIPSRPEVEPLKPQLGVLKQTISLYHEDNFAELPQLTMVWPVVQAGHPDEYPLDYLAELLTDGKRAPIYNVLVQEKKLAAQPYAYNGSSNLAGQFVIAARANDKVDLDDVKAGIDEAFERFEKNGIDPRDMERIRNSLETQFYGNLSSALSKSFALAGANEFYGNPDHLKVQAAALLSVKPEDVIRVYNKYIAKRPYIVTSFVPKGQLDLIVEGATKAVVVEEKVTEGAEPEPMDESATDFARTPSKIDRSIKPALVGEVVAKTPEIYTADMKDGAKIMGVESDELPLVTYSIRFNGGALAEPEGKEGLASILTDLILEGTKTKTPEQYADAIGQLGASVQFVGGRENSTLYVNTLARNFEPTVALVMEAMIEPRFDEAEFERLKAGALARVQSQIAQPGYAASQAFQKVIYGADSRMARPTGGTISSIESLTIQDLKDYYKKYFNPRLATIHVVGAVSSEEVSKTFLAYNDKWQGPQVTLPKVEMDEVRKERVFFVDVPDSKQSVIYIGQPAPGANDPDYYKLTVVNERLGGSGGARLFQQLREEKGYTYGAYSRVPQTNQEGYFVAFSNVRANVTKESAELFKEILDGYADDYSEEDLMKTKTTLTRSEALANESLGDKLRLLQQISTYNLDADFKAERQAELDGMTLEEAKQIISKYIKPDGMRYIVVGDKATQMEGLKELGLGDPVILDREGNEIRS